MGFRKVGEFRTTSPLSVVKLGRVYRFEGNDFLPGFGAQQCYPNVIFQYQKGKLKLDRESMRKRLPSASELRTAKQTIRAQFKEPSEIPGELFNYVFALYYCGEVKRAHQFFDSVYPKNKEKKAFWWKFITGQISQSAYGKQIEAFARQG